MHVPIVESALFTYCDCMCRDIFRVVIREPVNRNLLTNALVFGVVQHRSNMHTNNNNKIVSIGVA